ncbi:hypothetical protein OHT68_06410 [Streptomyces canus]|uniref:hypothetical protein n=1 Tax=Streptomyces canus TaxID=58343 RepID=UPI002E29A214|nr:hypothetical protein [Streptomyces canus]
MRGRSQHHHRDHQTENINCQLASRALALDAALETALTTKPPAAGAGLPLRATETALLREWLQRLAS